MKSFTLNHRDHRRGLRRTRHWRVAGATLIALTVIGAGLFTGSTGMPHGTAARTTVGIRLADSASTSGQCVPGAQSPVIAGGTLTLSGPCTGTQGDSIPPGLVGQQGTGQQGQECQLTDAQQQELAARAQDQQAASDQAFQSSLLKHLLALAAAKATGAALTAQLSGHTGLSPQDVASLIQNGSVTPADMATAILQSLHELGESSGDVAIDTCAGVENIDNALASSSAGPQAGGNDQGGAPPPGPSGATPPADLGPDWVPGDPSTIPGSNGCDECAEEIQQKIGGTRYRIEPIGAPWFGKYRGQVSGWFYHVIDYVDGYIYDEWTSRYGEPVDQYLTNWEFPTYLKWTPIG